MLSPSHVYTDTRPIVSALTSHVAGTLSNQPTNKLQSSGSTYYGVQYCSAPNHCEQFLFILIIDHNDKYSNSNLHSTIQHQRYPHSATTRASMKHCLLEALLFISMDVIICTVECNDCVQTGSEPGSFVQLSVMIVYRQGASLDHLYS